MKVPFIDLAAQYKSLKPEIDQALNTVLANRNFIGGEAGKNFQRNFADLPFEPAYTYLKDSVDDFPVSAGLQKSVLSWPIYLELSEGQINYVCDLIRSFYGDN